jgi:hypothetical protein
MALLVSCDAFLFSREGRWNILDPDNELVEVNGLALPVARDGFVSAFEERYFDDPFLISEWMSPPALNILIQFDTSDLPEYVTSAVLELYVSPSSQTSGMDVYLIIEPWDENTVTWAQILSSSFSDTTVPVIPYLDVMNLGKYVGCDVTEYVQRIKKTGRNFGFLLTSWSNRLEFHSSRETNPPRLLVWGLDIPD